MRTDITRLRVAFHNRFAKAPKKQARIDQFFSETSHVLQERSAVLRATSSVIQATNSSSFGHAVLRIEGRCSLLTTAAGDMSGGVAEEFLMGAHDRRERQSQAFTHSHDESGTFKGAVSLTH